MKPVVDKVRREPALLVAFVSAVLILLTEFGVDLTAGQQASIIGVIIAIGAIIVRQSVTPNISVGALEDDQGNPNGELMAGQASSVPDGDPVDVVPMDGEPAGYPPRHAEQGAYDAGDLLVALAAIVVVLCGLVWLLRNL